MTKPVAFAFATLLGLGLLVAAGAWFILHGQEQAAQKARVEETAKANAAAVAEQQKIAIAADATLNLWRKNRDTLDRKKAEKRKHVEAARHDDDTYASWADRRLPDAAVRLLWQSRDAR